MTSSIRKRQNYLDELLKNLDLRSFSCEIGFGLFSISRLSPALKFLGFSDSLLCRGRFGEEDPDERSRLLFRRGSWAFSVITEVFSENRVNFEIVTSSLTTLGLFSLAKDARHFADFKGIIWGNL